jgi:S-adenosylmethionine uptake transporter
MFSMMDVLMKGASLAAGAYTALLWRNILATLMSGAAMARTPYRWPPASVMRLHILRAMLIAPMAWLFFWSLTKLPVAEVIGLSFIAPIIALALAPLLLGEKVRPNEIAAALLGVVGVAIILGGRFSGAYTIDALWGAGAVLVSAALFALNLLVQRRQAQVAGAIEVAFFQNALVLLLLLPFAPWITGSVDSGMSWLMIACSAALAVGSQITLSAAYARAPASRLIPFEYSAFLWACIWGWLIFAEVPTLAVLAGVVLIVVACLLAARQTPGIARVEAESA